MNKRLLPLLLMVAMLQTPTPCCAFEHALTPIRNHESPSSVGKNKSECPCCKKAKPVGNGSTPIQKQKKFPSKPCCPPDCPCVCCSVVFAIANEFETVSLPIVDAMESVAPPPTFRGHAGHRSLPERPPRFV